MRSRQHERPSNSRISTYPLLAAFGRALRGRIFAGVGRRRVKSSVSALDIALLNQLPLRRPALQMHLYLVRYIELDSARGIDMLN